MIDDTFVIILSIIRWNFEWWTFKTNGGL